ncbi:MAG: hypothetical protein ACJ74I_04115 [Gaiellaceae bacterium]
MSDFFGPPPPPPPEPPDHRSPEWSGPPENELAVVVPVQIELIRSDRLSLAIRALIVYSTGSMLMLALRRRKRPPLRAFGSPPFHASQPDSLRFGVRFADGSKATAGRPMRPGDTISPPALILRGTRNGGRSSETEMWMWPLPPPGLLEFVCEWRAEGIELTRRELDAQLILDAAAQVEELWPDERPVTPAWTGLG